MTPIFMTLETSLIALSVLAAILYAVAFNARSPSPPRTAVKTVAVGALAALAYVDQGPPALIAALVLSALGDAFLASDPKRWLPPGLGAFLAAHLAYIWLFARVGGGASALEAEPFRVIGVVGAIAAGAMMLTWLWSSIGPLRPTVAVYAAALAAMTAAAFTLPRLLWPAVPGAVLFLTSDALLSAELFKGAKSAWSGPAVWVTYYAAQAMIAYAFLR
jgi:uncharacterized membrane protein YhhN